MTYVYWIHLDTHTDISTDGYIGVSQNIERRQKDHLYMLENDRHENIHLTRAYSKYKDLKFSILVEGANEYCYQMENKLRPNKNIGWNIAEGGLNPPDITGKTWSHPPEFGKRISERNKKEGTYLTSIYNGSEEQKKMLTEKTKGVSRPWSAAIGKANKGKRTGDENPSKRPEVRELIAAKKRAWWAAKKAGAA